MMHFQISAISNGVSLLLLGNSELWNDNRLSDLWFRVNGLFPGRKVDYEFQWHLECSTSYDWSLLTSRKGSQISVVFMKTRRWEHSLEIIAEGAIQMSSVQQNQ